MKAERLITWNVEGYGIWESGMAMVRGGQGQNGVRNNREEKREGRRWCWYDRHEEGRESGTDRIEKREGI